MIEPTLTSLRETADRLDKNMEVSSPWVHAKLTPMLRDAADVIEGLEHENAKLQEKAARLFDKTLELATKNAKLRELVDILCFCMQIHKRCDDCKLNGAKGELGLGHDPLLACDGLHEMLKELGIEVD